MCSIDKFVTKYITKYTCLRILGIGIVLGALIWGCGIPRDVTIYNQKSFDIIEQDWAQNIDGVKIVLEDISDVVPVDKSEWIVLEHIVEPEMIGKSLVFYAEHQEVSIKVDNQEVYALKCPQMLTSFGSPGRTWVSVDISEEMLDKVVQVKLRSNFYMFQGVPNHIYSLSGGEIYSVQRDYLWVRNTLAIIVLILAVISYVNARIWEQDKMRRYLLSMADMYLFVALWVCAEINVLAIWSGRSALSAVMAMVFLRVIPITFYHFFRIILPYTTWRTKMMGALVWGNFIGTIVAQIFCGISMLHLLSIHIIVVAVISGLVILELVHYYKEMRKCVKIDKYDKALQYVAIIPVAALFEGYICVDYLERGQWLGIPITVASIIYAMISHVFLVNDESKTNMRKNHLENEYNNLHKKPLNQQINAHFLFNSLNTISAYCKSNPKLADKMVVLVAKYMREYMKLIGANEYITLGEELELAQKYMEIQNLRFEDNIKFSIDSSCNQVRLPAFALQTLVENAVNHGLKNKGNRGEVSIYACRKYNYAEIIVSDNGVGFDIQELKRKQGIGIQNLEIRLNAMGGSVEVASELDKGTAVTLWIPLDTVI